MNDWVRKILKDRPELLRRYEKSEARYIMQLPEDYDTLDIHLDISPDEMARFISALAELDLSLDEWVVFKFKELILAEKLKRNRKDGSSDDGSKL
jgi:hypothetical protein